MNFKYTGAKAIISEHGISFKQGKDDKYTYLPFVYEILNALNNDYEINKNHSYQIKKEELNLEKLSTIVFKYNPDFLLGMDEKINNYISSLDEEEIRIKKRVTLSDIEKDVYISNLQSMKEYKIQRAKNKIFYFYCISSIVKIIIINKLKVIDMPFNGKFLHVLKSVQSKLSSEKISSTLKVHQENDILKIKFVTNIY
ncbi:MAG: hypothetical protein KA055_02315 [Aliarcobacter sp.]|nr:hypothetical protein [Aliarcobacter sp.]